MGILLWNLMRAKITHAVTTTCQNHWHSFSGSLFCGRIRLLGVQVQGLSQVLNLGTVWMLIWAPLNANLGTFWMLIWSPLDANLRVFSMMYVFIFHFLLRYSLHYSWNKYYNFNLFTLFYFSLQNEQNHILVIWGYRYLFSLCAIGTKSHFIC